MIHWHGRSAPPWLCSGGRTDYLDTANCKKHLGTTPSPTHVLAPYTAGQLCLDQHYQQSLSSCYLWHRFALRPIHHSPSGEARATCHTSRWRPLALQRHHRPYVRRPIHLRLCQAPSRLLHDLVHTRLSKSRPARRAGEVATLVASQHFRVVAKSLRGTRRGEHTRRRRSTVHISSPEESSDHRSHCHGRCCRIHSLPRGPT